MVLATCFCIFSEKTTSNILGDYICAPAPAPSPSQAPGSRGWGVLQHHRKKSAPPEIFYEPPKRILSRKRAVMWAPVQHPYRYRWGSFLLLLVSSHWAAPLEVKTFFFNYFYFFLLLSHPQWKMGSQGPAPSYAPMVLHGPDHSTHYSFRGLHGHGVQHGRTTNGHSTPPLLWSNDSHRHLNMCILMRTFRWWTMSII